MKNVIITALLVSNLFTVGIGYMFTSGKIERHQPDYLAELTESPQPVKLARR